MPAIHVLSGGAAQGVVTQLRDGFKIKHGCDIDGTFGAVGMMKDQLLSGAPCDVLILTDALMAQLGASGQLVPGSARDLGSVKTGVAVRSGENAVDVSSPEAFKAALRTASGIYCPDPIKSTAGIHMMKVVRELGLEAELAGRLRFFPNGAAAMQAMAQANETGLLGCTQATEIIFTPGVELIALLPKAFELATTYTAAVCTHSGQASLAAGFIALMVSPDISTLRRDCGFEV